MEPARRRFLQGRRTSHFTLTTTQPLKRHVNSLYDYRLVYVFRSDEEVHPVDPGGHGAEHRHHHAGSGPSTAHHELLKTAGLLP